MRSLSLMFVWLMLAGSAAGQVPERGNVLHPHLTCTRHIAEGVSITYETFSDTEVMRFGKGAVLRTEQPSGARSILLDAQVEIALWSGLSTIRFYDQDKASIEMVHKSLTEDEYSFYINGRLDSSVTCSR